MAEGIPISDFPVLQNQEPTDVYAVVQDTKNFKEARQSLLLAESGAVRNCQLSFVSISSIDVGLAGLVSLVKDDGAQYNMSFSGAKTIDFTTTGINALDAGVVAVDTWYAIYVIGDSTGLLAPETIASTNAVAPAFPPGFDIFRRVGWARTTVAALLRQFEQRGVGDDRRYYWTGAGGTLVILAGGNAVVFTAVSLATLVPPTSTSAFLNVNFNGVVLPSLFRFRATGSTTAIPVTSYFIGAPGGVGWTFNPNVVTDSAQSIEYLTNNAGNALEVAVEGYIDHI